MTSRSMADFPEGLERDTYLAFCEAIRNHVEAYWKRADQNAQNARWQHAQEETVHVTLCNENETADAAPDGEDEEAPEEQDREDEEELQDLDVMALTPIDAMNRLFLLREKARKI